MDHTEIIRKLMAMSNPEAVAGMARFGIHEKKAYGVPMPALRELTSQKEGFVREVKRTCIEIDFSNEDHVGRLDE
jgi:DNA alkylation repair enzyme